MKLSVVIACFNEEATLAEQFEGLAIQEWSRPCEIVFVDNGSTDDSRAIAEHYQTRLGNLRIVDASAKRGKSFALNQGVEAALGESIAFADADDQVAPGGLPLSVKRWRNTSLSPPAAMWIHTIAKNTRTGVPSSWRGCSVFIILRICSTQAGGLGSGGPCTSGLAGSMNPSCISKTLTTYGKRS